MGKPMLVFHSPPRDTMMDMTIGVPLSRHTDVVKFVNPAMLSGFAPLEDRRRADRRNAPNHLLS